MLSGEDLVNSPIVPLRAHLSFSAPSATPAIMPLTDSLGLATCLPQTKQLVTTYPAVLSRSVEKNLEPKFKWLEVKFPVEVVAPAWVTGAGTTTTDC